MVEDNVKEVADALNDLTEDLTDGIEIIPPDNVVDIADTLEKIADVEDPSEEASVFVFVFVLFLFFCFVLFCFVLF